jgi:hypothetical protein
MKHCSRCGTACQDELCIDGSADTHTPVEGLPRFGVVHRHKPGDPLYSHLPMADGYWTPWHIAEAQHTALLAALASLVERMRNDEPRFRIAAAGTELVDTRLVDAWADELAALLKDPA